MSEIVYLFVPGHDAQKISKAFQSQADVIIIDLEDAVRIEEKEEARAIVKKELVKHKSNNKKIMIRINSEPTSWFYEDIKLVKELDIHAVMLPKCENPSSVLTLSTLIPELEIIPLIESARGVLNAESIIKSCSQIKKIAFGAVDFALDIGTEWSPEGTERFAAMSHLVLVSRTAGKDSPIDAVFPLIHDKEALQKDTMLGKKMGFYGKMVIHPKHIEWVKEVYRPSEEDIEKSRKIIEEYERNKGSGAFIIDGKLIDLPVYRQAKRILSSIENIR
jgi:citrate lyase subunit beta/citryl-CoA lyase